MRAVSLLGLVLAFDLLLGCRRNDGRNEHLEKRRPTTVESDVDEGVRARAAAGVPQGAVRPATAREAALMITVEPVFVETCPATLAADILQRAGFSVWTGWSPCLEEPDIMGHVWVERQNDGATYTFIFRAWRGETLEVSRRVDGQRNLSRTEVQDVLREAIRSAKFQKWVADPVRRSGDRFVVEPIPMAQLERACPEGAAP
jgi:hypothetical protein